jgi:divalent metal cation (Fe/Co/Zn/Cd) transporter
VTSTDHAGALQPRHDEAEHRSAANRALALSALGLFVTGTIELVLAVVTHSVGLLSDALHNLSDVSTSALVFFGFRVSKRPASTRFSYGYERAEDVAGLGVALVIWGSAAFAGYESYRKFVHHSGTTHLGWGNTSPVRSRHHSRPIRIAWARDQGSSARFGE